MKQKLLLALLALFTLGGSNLFAQTDVTSTYLTNADFEGEYSVYSNPKEDRAIYQPTGWTVAYSNGDVNDMTALNSSCLAWNNFSSRTQPTNGGNNTYWIRFRWGNSENLQLSQTKTLPIGYYTLSADALHTGGATATISAGGKTTTIPAGSSWSNYSVSFSLEAETEVTFAFKLQQTSTTESVLAIDNFKLTWTDPNAAANAAKLEAAKFTLNGYIKKATALNVVLANETLATAITTAQTAYDNANDYAEDYDNTVEAAETLNTAITTALTDATAVALTNGNFDTTPNNILNEDGTTTFGGTLSTATSNPDNTMDMSANTGDHGYLYDVTGWTQYSKFNSTASQGTTSEYGTAMPDNGWSTNSTTPPTMDMFGASEGAALHLSAGWGDQARYQQTIESLPTGRYLLYYEVINQHNNTGIASNYIGVNATAGDFYGTTNSFVYSDLKTIEQGVWKAQAFEFNVAKEANINFSIGVTTSTSGSGNGAKLWIDNVLVYRIGDITMSEEEANAILTEVAALDDAVYNAADKNNLATSKNAFEASKTLDNYNALNVALSAAKASVEVYKTLNTAISYVEGWTSNATTVTDPIRAKYTNGEYSNETTASDIYGEYQAAEIAAISADPEATDYTSVILNHSFETGDMTGWSAESRNDTGVKENSNGTYTINNDVDGNYIFNSWGGSAENNVYQTIKNLPAGTYQLTALLAGFTGEKLVLAANDVTNSVTVEGDKGTGNTVNVVFTLEAAADVVIKASNTKATSADASFIKADNFCLVAYSDALAALKEQLKTLQEQAKAALNNADYANVTGDEKTTLTKLSTLVPEETEDAYNTAISNITAAISAFTNAKAAYDVYAEIKNVATTLEVETGDAPANANAAVEAANTLNVVVYQVATAENMFDITNDINPSWSDMSTASGQHWSGDGNVSYADNWSGSANTTERNASITLPAGEYVLMSAGRGSTNTIVTMTADEITVTYTSKGDTGFGIDTEGHANFDASGTYANNNNGRGWEWRYIPVTLTEETTLTLNQKLTRLSGNAWGSFADFKIMKKTDVADADDYAALAAAIETAEAKTLGFDVNEFAPYNNVVALQTLAAAKAIETDKANAKETVQAITAKLTAATWTTNTEEVNAVFNGMFNSEVEGDWGLTGWTRTNAWGQQQTGIEGEYATAYYNQPGSLKYGDNGVYTMPLKENTVYVLNFVYRAHENGSNNKVTVSVLNGEDGVKDVVCPGNGSTSEWKTGSVVFTTGAAGNYVLTLANDGNTWMTNVSIFKAKSVDITIKEGFTATTYSNADYALDFSNTEGLTAAIITDAEGREVEVDDAPAGTGLYVKAEPGTYQAYILGASYTNVSDNKLVGTGSESPSLTSNESTTYYVFGRQGTPKKEAFYKVKTDKATTVSANKAYLKINVPASEAKDVITVGGGETDGINAVEAAETLNSDIYNLQGQKVNRATRGIYIVNGKKVILK